MSELREKCGVFGVYGKDLEASRLTFFGLYALQHRGQEGAGIVTSDGKKLRAHKGMGLVSSVFTEEKIKSLKGDCAVGHTRYSTSGSKAIEHIQPITVQNNSIALAHNGNLPSVTALKKFLDKRGITVPDGMDSIMMAEALGARVSEGIEIEQAIKELFPLFTGAFSLLLMTSDKLIALRDSKGVRPLSIGTLDGGYVFSSETCGLNTVGAEFLRDVAPGEMVVVDRHGLRSTELAPGETKLDIFEFVYFSRHDSEHLGQSVYEVRKRFGQEFARENSLDADVVIPVPETAIPFALGYSQETEIPFEMGLTKNRYIHRTFISPGQQLRERGVEMKLSVLRHVIENKRVIVADDSIVRGTTSRQIVDLLFAAGAKEVHFVVSSPPICFPDFYGIDTPTQESLFAATRSIEEMRAYLHATSLHFLSFEGMLRATGLSESLFSTSCFSGVYPIDLKERLAEVRFDSPTIL
ncbi:MAG: amidophosphoribosyltransferase [Candidatus Paceibacterota bacterium]